MKSTSPQHIAQAKTFRTNGEALTPRQVEFLYALENLLTRQPYPLRKQIAAATGYSSLGGLNNMLQRLHEKGAIIFRGVYPKAARLATIRQGRGA